MAKSQWVTVVDSILTQIEEGRLKPGDRLPSVARMCEMYGAPSMAIRNALLTLKAGGQITGVPGVGVFVGTPPPPPVPPRSTPRRAGCTWKTADRRPKR